MRLYRTTLGQWAGTQADARAFKATHGVDFEQVEVPTDKAGLLDFLNAHQVGASQRIEARAPEPIAYGEAARMLEARGETNGGEPMAEDAFEALPLAKQLHLAALALENARDGIKPKD